LATFKYSGYAETYITLNTVFVLLVYRDDVTVLSGNKNIIKRNTEALLEASSEVGLEVNTKKTKCEWSCLATNMGRKNHNLPTANKSFESVAKFKNSSRSKLCSSRLNLGKACYHSVQNI
jgi:hypothetical protein